MPQTLTPLTIHVVSDSREFDELQPAWTALQAASLDSSIFLSWDWQRLWWEHYGAHRQLRILVAGDAQGVVGLLPLYLETQRRARGAMAIRKLRQIGVGGDTSPDDLGGLFVPGQETPVAAAMARFLAHGLGAWDVLDFCDLPADSPLALSLGGELSTQGLRVCSRLGDPITFGDLPTDWETYRQGLSRNRRETMRRKRKKFEAQPGARFRIVDSSQELAQSFEHLVRLHHLRWSERTERPGFSTPQYQGFHRDLMQALLPQGRLRLLALELGDQPIAMLYGYLYKRRFSFFQSGFDPAHAEYSPGDVLMSYAVEYAISQACTVFDMLKGDHDYKRHFFQQDRRNLEIRVFRRGLIDLVYRLHDALRPGAAFTTASSSGLSGPPS